MGDVDERHAGALLDGPQFGAHMLAQFKVERGERLVEQHHLGFHGEGAGDGDALLLPARELVDALVGGVRQRDEVEELLGALSPLVLRDAADLEPEGDVFPDAHQRKQREVLEDKRGGAAIGADAGQVLAADPDFALAWVDKAGDHAQDRRLAAARGAEEAEELACLDRQ